MNLTLEQYLNECFKASGGHGNFINWEEYNYLETLSEEDLKKYLNSMYNNMFEEFKSI